MITWWSIKLSISIRITFYLTKTEKRPKKSLAKVILSETTDVCVLTYQILSFYHNSKEFQAGGTPHPTPTTKQAPKKPTLIRIKRPSSFDLFSGFTLKRVRDMTKTYSQMHRTDKYSEHSSLIRPVWSNGSVFVYKLSGSGFESSCSH